MALVVAAVGGVCALAQKFQVGRDPAPFSMSREIGSAFLTARQADQGFSIGPLAYLCNLHPLTKKFGVVAMHAPVYCLSGLGRLVYQVERVVTSLNGNGYQNVQLALAKIKKQTEEQRELMAKKALLLQTCEVLCTQAHQTLKERGALIEKEREGAVKLGSSLESLSQTALSQVPPLEMVEKGFKQMMETWEADMEEGEEAAAFEEILDQTQETKDRLECELIYQLAQLERLQAREEAFQQRLSQVIAQDTLSADVLESLMIPIPGALPETAVLSCRIQVL